VKSCISRTADTRWDHWEDSSLRKQRST